MQAGRQVGRQLTPFFPLTTHGRHTKSQDIIEMLQENEEAGKLEWDFE